MRKFTPEILDLVDHNPEEAARFESAFNALTPAPVTIPQSYNDSLRTRLVSPDSAARFPSETPARAAILALQKETSHRLFWRFIMPTSIAATLLAAITLFFVQLTSLPVSAAETLKDVAATNRAYPGWIHITTGGLPEKNGATSVTTIHINTKKQIFAKVIERGDSRDIEWLDRSVGTYEHYYSAGNEWTLMDLPAEVPILQIQEQMKAHQDLTAQQLLGLLVVNPTTDTITALVDYGCTVTQREEGTNERFDLAMPNPKGAQSSNNGAPFLTVFVDKQSKLLQRCSTPIGGGEVTLTYTYGAPDIQSMRNLGLPQDVKLVDLRVKRELQAKTLMARLDARIGVHEKLGDYVALETQTTLGPGGESYNTAVILFARSGDKRFFGRYWYLAKRKLNLAGWPTPGMTFVRSAKAERPDNLFVTDGTNDWLTGPDGKFHTRKPGLLYAEPWLLSGTIWPGRWCVEIHGNPQLHAQVQALNDGPYPGLKVSASGYAAIIPNAQFDLMEDQWRIDPARDDVPVTHTHTLHLKDGTVVEETQSKYLEYAQLPAGGSWYPTRWTDTTTQPGKNETFTVEHRLQILPNEQLDPVWFTDPDTRPFTH